MKTVYENCVIWLLSLQSLFINIITSLLLVTLKIIGASTNESSEARNANFIANFQVASRQID